MSTDGTRVTVGETEFERKLDHALRDDDRTIQVETDDDHLRADLTDPEFRCR